MGDEGMKPTRGHGGICFLLHSHSIVLRCLTKAVYYCSVVPAGLLIHLHTHHHTGVSLQY